MQATTKMKTQSPSFKTVLSAVKKLSMEEKQMLRLQLFSTDAMKQMKDFEIELKKKKKFIVKTDDEIVSITTAIRRKKYATTLKKRK